MSDFERLYKDGVETERLVSIEKDYHNSPPSKKEMLANLTTEDVSSLEYQQKMLEKLTELGINVSLLGKIDEPKSNSRRTVKKSTKRHDKI